MSFNVQADIASKVNAAGGNCSDMTKNLLMEFAMLGDYQYLYNPKKKSYLYTTATRGKLLRNASQLESDLFDSVYSNMKNRVDLYAKLGKHLSEEKKCDTSSAFCIKDRNVKRIMKSNANDCKSIVLERY